ncbi:MAG: hypothetical protein QNK37_31485 [Acidobacteriota bacterium]|nr:hypothetical protein [Acidobacteriota bacterium]
MKKIVRGVDARWSYEEIVSKISIGGFNPYHSTIFTTHGSPMLHWWQNPYGSPRPYNHGDYLMKDILFFLHDYFHVWSYNLINEIVPEIGFGSKPISGDNFEDFVFCHLLTETVATIAVDYWFLCSLDINEVVDIGSGMITLTAPYHKRHEKEYRRFNPDFVVQDPSFFILLHNFYCSGEFKGFDINDVRNSQLLLRWLKKELVYGGFQREYSRMWIHSLWGMPPLLRDALRNPVATNDKSWKEPLVKKMSDLLWKVVKENQYITFRIAKCTWSGNHHQLDARLKNLNRVEDAFTQSTTDIYFLEQFISRYSYDEVPPELISLVKQLKDSNNYDPNLLRYLFRDHEPLSVDPYEPEDLFMLA